MNSEQSTAGAALLAWVAAEAGGDAATIGGLLSDEVTGVGPLGFVAGTPGAPPIPGRPSRP